MKALLALLLCNALAALGQPAQIILFRHAEKSDEPSALHLSPRGEIARGELPPPMLRER